MGEEGGQSEGVHPVEGKPVSSMLLMHDCALHLYVPLADSVFERGDVCLTLSIRTKQWELLIICIRPLRQAPDTATTNF